MNIIGEDIQGVPFCRYGYPGVKSISKIDILYSGVCTPLLYNFFLEKPNVLFTNARFSLFLIVERKDLQLKDVNDYPNENERIIPIFYISNRVETKGQALKMGLRIFLYFERKPLFNYQ